MTTMRELVDAYEQRYFSGNGKELANRTGIEVYTESHDIYHIMPSGVCNVIVDGNVDSGFEKIERAGLVDKIFGIKAEILAGTYGKVFECLSFGQKVSVQGIKDDEDIKAVIKLALHSTNAQMREKEINQKGHGGIIYSDNKAINDLYKSYNVYRRDLELPLNTKSRDFNKDVDINTFISDQELEFHVKAATELFLKIAEKIPEVFINGVNEEPLLDLDIKKIQIDNFTATEKAKLRKIGRNKEGVMDK